MDKAEFVGRVLSWARRRYGLELTEAWIDDLIKDRLIPEAIRKGNDGLIPIYSYDCLSYRTALQIARLRRDGFIGRNSIRLQLFVKGYSVQFLSVKRALFREYIHYGKSILSQIRSGYIDNRRSIPDRHKQSLARSLGPIDKRFAIANLKLDSDVYIEMLRKAKQMPIDPRNSPTLTDRLKLSISQELTFSSMAMLFPDLMTGLLMLDPGAEDGSPELDHLEPMIRRSDKQKYEQAREFYRSIMSSSFVRTADFLDTDSEERARRDAFQVVSKAVKNDPRWASLVLVLGLVIAHRFSVRFTADQAQECFRCADEQRLNLIDLVQRAVKDKKM